MIPPPPFTNTDANFYPSYTEANKESATFYSNPMTESAPVASSTVLPPRIVDYFITIGQFSFVCSFRLHFIHGVCSNNRYRDGAQYLPGVDFKPDQVQ